MEIWNPRSLVKSLHNTVKKSCHDSKCCKVPIQTAWELGAITVPFPGDQADLLNSKRTTCLCVYSRGWGNASLSKPGLYVNAITWGPWIPCNSDFQSGKKVGPANFRNPTTFTQNLHSIMSETQFCAVHFNDRINKRGSLKLVLNLTSI